MLIFIDESGDAGFKSKGSSAAFVISLIIFDDDIDAEETALRIKKLKRSLNKKESFEFKFNKSNKDLRVKFLREIKSCKFRVRSIVLQKKNLYSPHLRSNKESFYNFALRMVLEHNNRTVRNAKIRIDGSGEIAFRKNLTVYLRQNLNKSEIIMKNLRFKDSKKDVLVQLADMVAGSIRRSYDRNYTDYKLYRKIIDKRIEDNWEFK